MNAYALISFMISVLSLFAAVYVASQSLKTRLNQLFVLMAICLVIWSFSEFETRISATVGEALLFGRMQALGWAFIASIFLHFSLVFARAEKLLKSKLLYIMLYVPPAVFYILLWFTNLVYEYDARLGVWGFSAPEPAAGFTAYTAYMAVLLLVSFIVFFRVAVRSAFRIEKKKAMIFLSGVCVSVIAGFATDIVLPLMKVPVVEMGSLAAFISLVLFFYAVVRYEFMGIVTEREAEKMFNGISSILIIFDAKMKIVNINRAAEELLGYKAPDLKGKDFSFAFGRESGGLINALENAVGGKESRGVKGYLKSRTEGDIPVLAGFGIVWQDREAAGVTVAAADIRQALKIAEGIKSASRDLEKKVGELKSWKRLTDGREARIAELQKELDGLLRRPSA